MSPQEIVRGVASNNFNFPAGNIKRDDREILVRTMGAYENVEAISELVVNLSEKGAPVYLRNIAEVLDSYKERTSVSYFNTDECVAIILKKEAGKNSVIIADEARELIDSLNKEFGNKVKLIVVADQSKFIRESISGVALAGIQAIVICFLFCPSFLEHSENRQLLLFRYLYRY